MNTTNKFLNICAFIVLLVLSFILGLLGKPTEMGLSILAGAIALSFINIDKIKRFKGAGFEAEMQEKLEAIIEKETEPHQCENNGNFITFQAYGTDEKAKKVINALNNTKYTWRYSGGIIKDSGLSKSEVTETLDWLLKNHLGKFTEGEHGRLWALSAKGRKVFNT
jgi:hypothetical protein